MEHMADAIVETLSRGGISKAQDAAEDIIGKNPSILNDFNRLVEECRKCSKADPVIK